LARNGSVEQISLFSLIFFPAALIVAYMVQDRSGAVA
jgi:hypothetical protein